MNLQITLRMAVFAALLLAACVVLWGFRRYPDETFGLVTVVFIALAMWHLSGSLLGVNE